MKYSFAVLLLSACSCSHTPVASAQHDLSVIQDDYDKARAAEVVYDALPPCMISVEKTKWNAQCSDPVLIEVARTAGFNAEAALTIAEGERTNAAISIARDKVKFYRGTLP